MHTPAQKHTQRETTPWASNTETALETSSSGKVAAGFPQVTAQLALRQDHQHLCVARCHFHLHLPAGTCCLQTAAGI